MKIIPIDPAQYTNIVFFTGAGMSAECGIPTYRGSGGIWDKYNWEEVACQNAFDSNPQKVLDFHEIRRSLLLNCYPHNGHQVLAALEQNHPGITIVTQNIDGMHQRAGSGNVIELHGSLWRLRCPLDGRIVSDTNAKFKKRKCECGAWLRPDIIWFGDSLNSEIFNRAHTVIEKADLFVSIGTSGMVWPAAGFPKIAADKGAKIIEINPDALDRSEYQHVVYPDKAGTIIPKLFPNFHTN